MNKGNIEDAGIITYKTHSLLVLHADWSLLGLGRY